MTEANDYYVPLPKCPGCGLRFLPEKGQDHVLVRRVWWHGECARAKGKVAA
jgi:hypothetical protein